MTITTMIQLEERKKEHAQIVEDLHKKYSDFVVFQEEMPNGEKRRPLFVLREPKQADYVNEIISRLEIIEDEITQFTGKKVRFNPPVLCENVLMCRVWENTATSSSTITTTREMILSKLRKQLATAGKYTDQLSRIRVQSLKEEIVFFESDKEQVYRRRSLGNKDIVTRIYYHGKKDERVRVKAGGLFIVGFGFEEPKVDLPSVEKQLKRKGRPTVFDNIMPIKYSGAANTLLYRESDVIEAKSKIGMTQEKNKDSVLSEDGK